MSGRPGFGPPPNQRNPFSNPAPLYGAPRRDYDSESEAGDSFSHRDTYNTVNSTTRLTSAQDPFGTSLAYHPTFCTIDPPFFIPVRNDSESEIDVYSNNYEGSVDSHTGYPSGASFSDAPGPRGSKEPYPAWTADRQIPISPE